MTSTMKTIRQALEGFVATYEQNPDTGVSVSMGNDRPRFRITPSGLSEDIHAVVYIPQFDQMSHGERQDLVWSYLRKNASLEVLKHLSLLRTVSSMEWDEVPGLPPLDWPTAVGAGS